MRIYKRSSTEGTIVSEPYAQEFTGQIYASQGRRLYQLNKKKEKNEKG